MPGFMSSLAFRLISGLAGLAAIGAVVGYILSLQANLKASKAETVMNQAALATAQTNNRTLAAAMEKERQGALEREAASKRATATYKAQIAAAEAQQTVLTRTITIEREKDATLDTCLALHLPDGIVRNLAH
ncbi:MAG: hypothetical protein COB49_02025 [Alphaproteobacteria bacterium]|nr:MAG: hypothetical protein COB49_02025 [Alphaproteobacteria bacterium]